jgi:hypothetical protein
MKRVKLIVFFMMFAAGWGFSQSITITSPNGGEDWQIGSAHMIQWASSGISGDVKIGLFKGGAHIGNIVEHQPYVTGYLWHLGDPLLNGVTYGPDTDYAVQVQSEVDWHWKSLSNSFTITAPTTKGAGPLEGTFAIDGVTFTVINNVIEKMSILVSYSALNDFRVCVETTKCHPEFGSMFVQYTLTNYEKKNDQIVPDTQTSCVFACRLGCGEIEYPRYTLKKGTDKFWLHLSRLKPDKVWGVKDTRHGDSIVWGMYKGHTTSTFHEPEVDVTLTLCVSKLDPPNSYSYKLVPVTFKAKVSDCKLIEFENDESGWF